MAAGDGTDTLSMTGTNAATATSTAPLMAAFSTAVTGFERLTVTSTASTVDVAGLLGATNTSYVTVTGAGNTIILNNLVTSGTGATVNINGANTGVTLGGTSGAGGTDIVNLNLNNTGAAPVNFGTITAPNVETLKITSNDTQAIAGGVAHLNVLAVTDVAVTTITVSGNEGLALTAAGAIALTSFDSSAVTSGAVTFTTAALQYASTCHSTRRRLSQNKSHKTQMCHSRSKKNHKSSRYFKKSIPQIYNSISYPHRSKTLRSPKSEMERCRL